MRIQRVLIDKYSNAEWIRHAIDELPDEAYRISAVEKPFGSRPVEALVRRWLGSASEKVLCEIQHFDQDLMDQGMSPGHKQAGLLLGAPRNRGIRPRGI